jgi:hypothetical protein
LEQVLRRLIRLLVGRLTLARLTDLIRKVYVQEAERYLQAEHPQHRATLSQLALLTGIDTRTLTKLINDSAYAKPSHQDQDFLLEMTPETRIISAWMSDQRFRSPKSGKPLALTLDSGPQSFTKLLATALAGRGFTEQSVLRRLESARSVKIDRNKHIVRLTSTTYYPFISDDESAMLDVGLTTSAALLETIYINLERARTGEEKLFQRSAFTHQLSPQRKDEFRSRLRGLLAAMEDSCKSAMAEIEDAESLPGQITAGVSMFYFEESDSAGR